jgi:predicted Zn-dependent peptidase
MDLWYIWRYSDKFSRIESALERTAEVIGRICIDMKFQRTTLDNGLEIIAESNEAALSTALGFFVTTGSRDETDEIAGVSHFLEHMAFKGTERRTAEDVNRELDELGGNFNAATSQEETMYYGKVLPEHQERAVALLGDILRPALRQEDFDVEKKVILEEIRMCEEQPPYGVDDKRSEYFWSGHPISRSVLGSRESVSSLTPEVMREYFERRYSPTNVVFVAAGQVDFDKLTSWVDAACGKWKPVETSRELRGMKGIRGTHVITRENTTLEYVYQLVDAPSLRDEERYAAAMLAMILGADVGSYAYWELVDSGRADSARLFFEPYVDLGAFVTSMTCRAEDASDNLRSFRDVLENAQSNGVEERKFELARAKSLTSIALSGERPLSRLGEIGGNWIVNKEYESVEDLLGIIRRLTLDDVNAVMKHYSFSDPFTIAIGSLDSLEL